MKKYLIKGFWTLVACILMTSCHDEVDYTGTTLAAKAMAYEQSFREAYGDIDPNQDWGFGSESFARTRGYDTDANNWAINGWNVPDIIPQATKDKVIAEFSKEHREGNTININFTNFFVQQVFKGTSEYTPKKSDGSDDDNIGQGSNYMNYLTCGNDEPIYNFNWGNGSNTYVNYSYDDDETKDLNDRKKYHNDYISLMKNSSTSRFGYYNSWTDENKQHYEYIILQIDGDYYVGFDFCGQKADGTHVDQDYKYNDWIVKITEGIQSGNNGGGTTPGIPTVTVVEQVTKKSGTITTEVSTINIAQCIQQGRVFCEDLGSSGRLDIDFNDLVFDAQVFKKYTITRTKATIEATDIDTGETSITTETSDVRASEEDKYESNVLILAAGGTLNLTIAGEEVHNLFGKETTCMINTVTSDIESKIVGGSNYNQTPLSPVELTNLPYSSIAEIPIIVRFMDDVEEIDAIRGSVPRKILVPLGTQWAKERTAIDEAYTDFQKYVNNGLNFWNGNKVDGLVYDYVSGYHGYDTYFEDRVGEPTTTTEPYNENEYQEKEITVSQTMAEPGASETKLWEAETRLIEYNRGNFEIYPYQLSNLSTSQVIRIYGVGATGDWNWQIRFNSTSYNAQNTDLANIGYFDIPITDENLQRFLTGGIRISGTNFTLTYVTIAPAPVDPTKPGQFWPESGKGNATGQFAINANTIRTALANATTNNKICVYITGNFTWLQLFKADWSNWEVSEAITNWTINGGTMYPSNWGDYFNSSTGKLEIPLTEGFLNCIKQKGLGFNFGDMTFTNITLE